MSNDKRHVHAPFLKLRKDVFDDPDVIRIADLTGLDEYGVVGRLSDIWCWVDSHSVDGTGLTVSDRWIDRRVNCDGFAKAMRNVDWLEGEDGSLKFPKWDRHNSNTAKARALEAEAKRLRRVSDNSPTDVGQQSDKTTVEMSDQSKSMSKSKSKNSPSLSLGTEPLRTVRPSTSFVVIL